jgi:modification target Cys-rich repeat protein
VWGRFDISTAGPVPVNEKKKEELLAMALIKKVGFFGAPLLIMAAGALATQGCDPGDVCGPCGEIENGATGISGSAKLDGFFKAVSVLNASTATATAQFEGGLANLEAAFGLSGEGTLDVRVDDLITAISGEIEASASAGLSVDLQPAKCEANVNVAVEAQADCEVEAGCSADVKCDPGEVSVKCEGSCTGSCSGSCSGDVSCTVKVEGGGCEGTCEGSCELEASATCEGTCRGTCTGECSAYASSDTGADAECAGECKGECQGTCELKAGASCSGTCTGKCTAPSAEGECTGEVKCEGSCEGECSGGCEGTAKAPSCEGQASCDARADCEASASAQASASVECTPPSIAVNFAFDGDASAKASFTAKMAALQANAGVMLGSTARLESLFTGDGCAAASISASLQDVISAGVEGSLFVDVPSGKLPCVLPALEESATILGTLTSEATASISAQAKFATAFAGGFSS